MSASSWGRHSQGAAGAAAQLGKQFMPAFGKGYSDADIAALVYYVTGRFGARATAPDQVAGRREKE